MGDYIQNSQTSLLGIQTKNIPLASNIIVYLSTTTNVGQLITIRDMDGFLSTPQHILVSTTQGTSITSGESTIQIEQRFGYLTLRSITPSTWTIVDENAFRDSAGNYTVRGVAYSSMIVSGAANITSSVTSGGDIKGVGLTVNSNFQGNGAFYASTLAVNNYPRFQHTVTDAANFIVAGGLSNTGSLIVQSTLSTTGSFACSTATVTGDATVAGGVSIGGTLTFSTIGGTFTVADYISTAYTTTVAANLSVGGAATISTGTRITRNLFVSSLTTRGLNTTVAQTDALTLSTGLEFVKRTDISVVDPTYGGITTPIVYLTGAGLAATSLIADCIGASSISGTQGLSITSSISSPAATSLVFGSAAILNPFGSITISSAQIGTFDTVGSVQGPVNIGANTLTASTLAIADGITIAGTANAPLCIASTFNGGPIVTSSINTGTVEMRGDSLTLSTLFISSGLITTELSSITVVNATIVNTSGNIITSTLRANTAVPAQRFEPQTIRPADGLLLTFSTPLLSISSGTLTAVTAQTVTTSSLQTTTVRLGAPLLYSTVGPYDPYVTTSTVAGVSTNSRYEYIQGLGTTFQPLQIHASLDRTVNIYLQNISSGSTCYFNANMTYRNDSNLVGNAGLRIVNAGGASTIISFNASPYTPYQTSNLSNYLIDLNAVSGTSNYFLTGPNTLQPPSTITGNPPIIAGGTSANYFLYNPIGDGTTWSTISSPMTYAYGFAWNGKQWMAAGEGTNNLAYSYNGTTWAGLGSNIFTTRAKGFAWNGNLWVGVGEGANTIGYSYNGINWFGLGNSIFFGAFGYGGGQCAAWNGTTFVVGGGPWGNSLAYSYDGLIWTGLNWATRPPIINGISWGKDKWVAVGGGNNSPNQIAYSTDGLNWSTVSTTFSAQVGSQTAVGYCVAYNGSRWVAGGSDQGSSGLMMYSDDGLTWTRAPISSIMNQVNGVTWSGSNWVATGIGNTNPIATSIDGATWVGASSNAIFTGYGIASRQVLPYGVSTTDLFIVGGTGSNRVAYNETPTRIVSTPIGGLSSVNGVAYGIQQWIAVGAQGDTAAYSPPSTNTWVSGYGYNGLFQISSIVYPSSFSTNAQVFSAYSTVGGQFLSFQCGNVGAASNLIYGGFSYGYSSNNTGMAYGLYGSLTPKRCGYILNGTSNDITSAAVFDSNTLTTSTIFMLINNTSTIDYYIGNRFVFNAPRSNANPMAASLYLNYVSSVATNVRFSPIKATPYPIQTSPNGTVWSTLNTNVVAYGNRAAWNGFQWIATGFNGFGNTIAYSYNSSNWSPATTSTFTTQAYGIAWGSNKWVVSGEGGANTLAYSANGETWIGLGSTMTTRGRGIAYNGTRYVGTGGLPNTLFYSADGISWTGLGSTIFNVEGRDVAWNGSLWVAVGAGTTNTIATSPDGITWTGQGATIEPAGANAVVWITSNWLVTGTTPSTLYTSGDGITWSTLSSSNLPSTGAALATRRLLPYGREPENSVIFLGCSNTPTAIAVSPDGVNFKNVSTLLDQKYPLTIRWTGRYWIAGGGQLGLPYQVTFISEDGINWSTPTNSSITTVNSVVDFAFGRDKIIGVGNNSGSTYVYSTDGGLTWGQQTGTGIAMDSLCVAFGGNVFIVGGINAGLKYSLDGASWTGVTATPSMMGTGRCLHYNGSLWVAGGQDTHSLGYSLNGSNWTFIGISTFTVRCRGLAYGNGVWVGVGDGTNTIAYSTDGSNWTGLGSTIFTNGVGYSGGYKVAWNGRYFTAVSIGYGQTGAFNTCAYSADGSNWVGLGSTINANYLDLLMANIASRISPWTIDTSLASTTTVTQEAQTFTWALTGITKVTQITVQKPLSGTVGWNARAASAQGFIANTYLAFQAGQTTADIMFGLSENPTATTSFTALNFAFNMRSDGTLQIYELGSLVANVGTYTAATQFKIIYDGTTVRYFVDSTPVRSIARSVGSALYMSSSFNTLGGIITAIDFHALYTLSVSQPALSSTGYSVTSQAGTNVTQFAPFYQTLTTNLGPSQWTIYVNLDGNVVSPTTDFYADICINEAKYFSTNVIQPVYTTSPSTYMISFSNSLPVTISTAALLSVRFMGTRGAGNTFLYTNYSTATTQRSSMATQTVYNPNAIDYIQFYHSTANSGLQTSELDFSLSYTSSPATTSYIDSNAGVEFNRGYMKWNTGLNGATIENRYNDITTRSLTYTGALYNASDPRAKEDIVGADTGALYSLIKDLPLRRYTLCDAFREKYGLDDRSQLGLIATEVSTLMPNAVHRSPEPPLPGLEDFQMIDRAQVRFAHLGATQALMARVSTLRACLRYLYSNVEGVGHEYV